MPRRAVAVVKDVKDTKVDELKEAAEGFAEAAKPQLPFSQPMESLVMGRGFDAVINTVIDERIDVKAEYEALEEALEIKDALTPEAVRRSLERVEGFALRASKLLTIAKVVRERYKIDMHVAMGSMRDQALAALEAEKKSGGRTKQITIDDVAAKVASIHPDEWRELSERLARAEYFVKHLERLAELWQRRSYTLASLAG